MGLVKGISPKLDLLVEKYFTVPDPENPEGAISRLRDGKIARKGSYDQYKYYDFYCVTIDLSYKQI